METTSFRNYDYDTYSSLQIAENKSINEKEDALLEKIFTPFGLTILIGGLLVLGGMTVETLAKSTIPHIPNENYPQET